MKYFVDGVGAVFAVPIAVTMLTRTELLFVFCVAAAFARACGSILPTRVKSFIFNTCYTIYHCRYTRNKKSFYLQNYF
jgi:hypothetical protein